MASEPRDVMLGIRVPASLRAKLERLAERDRRTLSDWIRLALERAADEADKPEKPPKRK